MTKMKTENRFCFPKITNYRDGFARIKLLDKLVRVVPGPGVEASVVDTVGVVVGLAGTYNVIVSPIEDHLPNFTIYWRYVEPVGEAG